jgi:acyl carrier protein
VSVIACPPYNLPLRSPNCAAIEWQRRADSATPVARAFCTGSSFMTSRADLTAKIHGHIAEFNKKGVDLADATTFAGDLEWDSLTVMDFVAAIEDEFDIIITMNMQAEIETVGQLVDAVEKLQG